MCTPWPVRPLNRSLKPAHRCPHRTAAVADKMGGASGAELKAVCTEAGMFAIRARKKSISEKDFMDSVNKVIKGYQKFSATPKYMVYN